MMKLEECGRKYPVLSHKRLYTESDKSSVKTEILKLVTNYMFNTVSAVSSCLTNYTSLSIYSETSIHRF
jgi:hypothetical protein